MKRRGFTLIELLVVIAIIGILTGIVSSNLSSARQSTRDAQRLADIKNIQLSLAQYYNDNYRYPCDIYTDPVSPACQPGFGTYIDLDVVPKDPGTGQNYNYAAINPLYPIAVCTGATWYHLGAVFESKTAEGDADDASLAGGGLIPRCSTGVGENFYGNSPTCSSSAASSPDYCYDVTQKH